MAYIKLGDHEAHEKLTAKILFKPAGGAGYLDFGNIKEYSEAFEYSSVSRVVAEYGHRRTTDEQNDILTAAWEFTLDEFDADLSALMKYGTQNSAVVQASVTAPSGTASITVTTDNLNKWLPIGAVGISTLVVKDDATPAPATLVEGTNYVVDLNTGMIKFLTNAGDVCALTFGNAAVNFESITALTYPTLRGDFILHEWNQASVLPLRKTTFTGVLRATEFPTQSGEFATYKFRVVATTRPAILRREAA